MDGLTIGVYVLAGLGLLLIAWAFTGACVAELGQGAVMTAVCRSFDQGQRLCRWHRYLVGAGLTKMPLLLIGQELTGQEKTLLENLGARFVEPGDLMAQLHVEDGSDDPGCPGAADGDRGSGDLSEHQ